MKITRNFFQKTNPDLICLAWKVEGGQIARWNKECCPKKGRIKEKTNNNPLTVTRFAIMDAGKCLPSLKSTTVDYEWECRVPDPEKCCPGTDRKRDPRCMPLVQGYGHPHVVMFDEFSYYVKIDFPDMY